MNWIYLWAKTPVKEVSEVSPAKEEKNESEAADGAGEKEKGEKHGQMLKLHFKQASKRFLHCRWNLENLSCVKNKRRQIRFHQWNVPRNGPRHN